MILKKLKEFKKLAKTKLFSYNNQEFTRTSTVLIATLDIILFYLVSLGISKEIRNASNIGEYTFLMEYLNLLKFTVPLLIISIIVYRFSSQKENSLNGKLGVLISSHLMALTFIPIFFMTLKTIWDLIPGEIIIAAFNLLYKFGSMFIGFYTIMFFVILLFGAGIYYSQKMYSKKSTKKDKKTYIMLAGALMRNKCPNCSGPVSYKDHNNCMHCGRELRSECSECKQMKINGFKHCNNCGIENKEVH